MTWKLITERAKPDSPLITPEEARLQGHCDCAGCGACWGGSACGLKCTDNATRCSACARLAPYVEAVRRRRAA